MIMETSREQSRKKLTLLVRDVIRNLEQIHVAQRHADILGLPASEAAREVRVAKDAGGAATVEALCGRVGVGRLALRRQALLAEEAVAAGDLERGDVALADLHLGDGAADQLDDAAELVAQDVAVGQLHHGAVVEVQVGAADGRAGDLEDHVGVFEDLGLGHVGYGRNA